MREDILSQNGNENLSNKEKILSNPAFKRFAGGFELYQELINNQDSPVDCDLIFNRMHELYKPLLDKKDDNQLDETQKNLKPILVELIFLTLRECEEEKFDINNFAEKISNSSLYNLFLKEWNSTAGDVEHGFVYLNEAYAYKIEDNDTISVHIMPSNIDSKDTNKKRQEGRRVLAEKLKNGELKANKILIKSWLLGKERDMEIRQTFGKDVMIENVPSDDKEYAGIQFLALQYNQKSLKKYLETGEKPEVRQIIMTSQEFIQKFS